VRGRVVAAERHPKTEQANHQREEIVADDQHCEKGAEHDHLGDEHPLASEIIRQATEQNGAEQNPEQAGGTDNTFFGRTDLELAHDQRQATPVIKTTKTSKNLPAAASPRYAIASRSSAPISGRCHPARPAVRDILLHRFGVRLRGLPGRRGIAHP